jgi:hypothetical protein
LEIQGTGLLAAGQNPLSRQDKALLRRGVRMAGGGVQDKHKGQQHSCSHCRGSEHSTIALQGIFGIAKSAQPNRCLNGAMRPSPPSVAEIGTPRNAGASLSKNSVRHITRR